MPIRSGRVQLPAIDGACSGGLLHYGQVARNSRGVKWKRRRAKQGHKLNGKCERRNRGWKARGEEVVHFERECGWCGNLSGADAVHCVSEIKVDLVKG